MKAIFYVLLVGAIGVLMFQLYRLYGQENALQQQMEMAQAKTGPILKENERMRGDIASLAEKDTVQRELRRAGYAAPGEKVFVIIPKR